MFKVFEYSKFNKFDNVEIEKEYSAQILCYFKTRGSLALKAHLRDMF